MRIYKDGNSKLQKQRCWEEIVNMWKNQLLKVKNSLWELEKEFIQLKDRELKDREVKIKRDIQELFLKMIWISLNKKNWRK